MEKEKRDDRAGDPIKSLIGEALEQERNEIMDSFSQILLQMSAVANSPSMSKRFGDETSFKVQDNFDIPLFEVQIDVDSLYNWLNVIEGYFSFHNFFDRENITFVLLKEVPHVQNWWGTYWDKNSLDECRMFETNPTWSSFVDVVKEQYYPMGNYDD